MVDPYYLGQREVSVGIGELHSLLGNRDDMLTDSRGGNPEIFKAIAVKMVDGIRTVRSLLQDLSATFEQIRANRSDFKISDSELAARESFVNGSRQEVDEIEKRMKSQTSNQKHQFNASAFQPIAPVGIPAGDPGLGHVQLQMHQEEQIDLIADSVKQQKQIGKMIVQEFDEQHQLILEIDAGIDDATSAMRKVTRQITDLIDNEGRAPTYLVAVLSVVLILMLWWVA
jgi:hypothetical protein